MTRRREHGTWVDEGPGYARSARQVREGVAGLLLTAGPAPAPALLSLERIPEPVAVARPDDANFTGPLRARHPALIAEMRRLNAGGATPAAIGEAYGVSARTVYRYLTQDQHFDVVLAGWRATFAVRTGNEPVRISRWRRAG